MSVNKDLPFSFQELNEATSAADPPPPPIFVTASEGVNLAVRVYHPPDRRSSPAGVLVFYHGGGAHSGAGYHLLARGLAEEYNLVVYTPDLRGHGASGGPRGDAKSVNQVFRDVNTILKYVMSQQEEATTRLFLGGHSSGGGFVINYATWSERNRTYIDGFVLLSPQLGHHAQVSRPPDETKLEFASVSILPFVANGIFGWMGHCAAVQFQYPPELLQDAGMVPFNTVNMANAITPTSPRSQLESIEMPLGLWIGNDDEMFVAEKVVGFCKDKPNMTGIVLPGENHLGILVHAHKYMGPWITEQINA